MKIVSFKIAAVTLAIGGLTMMSQVQAEPYFSHSAQICTKSDTSEPNSTLGVHPQFIHGEYQEPNPETVKVVCPMVRSTQNFYGAYFFVNAKNAANPEGGAKIRCKAYSTDFDGYTLTSTDYVELAAVNDGFIELAMGPEDNLSSEWSSYQVECDLPGNLSGGTLGDSAKIYSIDLSENDNQ